MGWISYLKSFSPPLALQDATPGIIAHAVDLFAALATPGLRQPLGVLLVEGVHALRGQGVQRGDGILRHPAFATE
ncbi:hypothetical protein D3C80_1793330 [compost metagenome]